MTGRGIRHGKVVLVAVLVACALSLGCKKKKCFWESKPCPPPDTDKIKIVRTWPTGERTPPNDRVVGVIATANDVSLTNLTVTFNSLNVALDSSLTPPEVSTLTSQLESLGLYDDSTEQLWFFQTTSVVSGGTGSGFMQLELNGGKVVSSGRITGIAARATDVAAGNPISNVVVTDDNLEGSLAPVQACTNSKLKATGKKTATILKALGKNISRNPDTKVAANISKAESKFTRGFTKAEAKGSCLTPGDAQNIEEKVNAFVADVVGEIAPSTSGAFLNASGSIID